MNWDVTLAMTLVGENETLDDDGVILGDEIIVGGTVTLHHVSLPLQSGIYRKAPLPGK